jgi:hypothetical protein
LCTSPIRFDVNLLLWSHTVQVFAEVRHAHWSGVGTQYVIKFLGDREANVTGQVGKEVFHLILIWEVNPQYIDHDSFFSFFFSWSGGWHHSLCLHHCQFTMGPFGVLYFDKTKEKVKQNKAQPRI